MLKDAPSCPLHGRECAARELIRIDDYFRPMLREFPLGILRK